MEGKDLFWFCVLVNFSRMQDTWQDMGSFLLGSQDHVINFRKKGFINAVCYIYNYTYIYIFKLIYNVWYKKAKQRKEKKRKI